MSTLSHMSEKLSPDLSPQVNVTDWPPAPDRWLNRLAQRSDALSARATAQDIHPTGPMWGVGELRPTGAVRSVEEAALAPPDLRRAQLLGVIGFAATATVVALFSQALYGLDILPTWSWAHAFMFGSLLACGASEVFLPSLARAGVSAEIGALLRRESAITKALAVAGINVDMIVQNVSAASTGRTDVTFTCPQGSAQAAMKALDGQRGTIGFESLRVDDQIAKVSLVGAGMRSHPGVSATFFEALADASINVEMISTSEIRISVVTRVDDAQQAVRALHTAFGLDADGEAVVYGGTGR